MCLQPLAVLQQPSPLSEDELRFASQAAENRGGRVGGYRCARGAGGSLQQFADPECLGEHPCAVTQCLDHSKAQCSFEFYTLRANSLRCKKAFS